MEIYESVGADNILLFGMKADEVEKLKASGYNPADYYGNNPVIKGVIDEMSRGINGVSFSEITKVLRKEDRYMALADFDSYANARRKAIELHSDKNVWNSMSLVNIAHSGRFAADRAIKEYADNIWHAKPVPETKKATAAQRKPKPGIQIRRRKK